MATRLSELIPQDEKFILDDKSGKEYTYTLFVPVKMSFIEKDESISETDRQLYAIECLLMPQFEFMVKEWIEDNLSLHHQSLIFAQIVKKNLEAQEAISSYIDGKSSGKKKKR